MYKSKAYNVKQHEISIGIMHYYFDFIKKANFCKTVDYNCKEIDD